MSVATDLEALAEKIKAMPPPGRLRLAADLLEKGKPDLAASIAGLVVDELRFALAMKRLKQR